MKKDNPGYYESPQYDPPVRPVTKKEKQLVRSMPYRQQPIERIRAEMEKRLGSSYSWDRIDMIRREIENGSAKCEAAAADAEGNETDAGKKGIRYKYEQPEGEDMRLFIEMVFGIKDMEPGTFIKIRRKGYELKLGADAVNDIQRITANSAASSGMNILETAKINNKHLCAEQIRLFSQGKVHSIKDLMMIDRILKDYESEGSKAGSEFEFIVKTVQRFAPEASREDILFYVSANMPDEGEVRESLLPTMSESMKSIFDWCTEHM
jgi:hypothetical protein